MMCEGQLGLGGWERDGLGLADHVEQKETELRETWSKLLIGEMSQN